MAVTNICAAFNQIHKILTLPTFFNVWSHSWPYTSYVTDSICSCSCCATLLVARWSKLLAGVTWWRHSVSSDDQTSEVSQFYWQMLFNMRILVHTHRKVCTKKATHQPIVLLFVLTAQKIDCDGIIGSLAKEDRCGVCNGDGRSCKIVRGDFNHTKGMGECVCCSIQVACSMCVCWCMQLILAFYRKSLQFVWFLLFSEAMISSTIHWLPEPELILMTCCGSVPVWMQFPYSETLLIRHVW